MHFKSSRRHTRVMLITAFAVLALVASVVASASTNSTPKPTPKHGVKGATFTKGAQGIKGIRGVKGATGPAGPAGQTGVTGQAGVAGNNGSSGAKGDKGDQGAQGPKAEPGANPLVFGPYQSSSADSSVCGNDWANDTYTRTYFVTPRSDGSFDVTEIFDGTFVTMAGFSPNDCTVQTAAGISGQFYGEYALTVPTTHDFLFKATCPVGCTTSQFLTTFFRASLPANYAWQFHYTTPSHGSWNNTDHGNTGNIF